MTATDPVAVDIDLTELGSDAKVPLDDRGWLESSHDLLRGLRVREAAMDSLPNDLIDVFARAKRGFDDEATHDAQACCGAAAGSWPEVRSHG